MMKYIFIALMFACIISIGCRNENVNIISSDDFTRIVSSIPHAKISEFDIDHDGTEEVFVGDPRTAGTAGMLHLIYAKNKKGYRKLGELFFSPLGFRVLPLGENGEPRMIMYWHCSCSEGILGWLAYRDGKFVTILNEHIFCGDGGTEEGNRRFKEFFGKNHN